MTKKTKNEATLFLENYLLRCYKDKADPLDKIYKLRNKFFSDMLEQEVYLALKGAYEKLKVMSGGAINFRYDRWFNKWRFFQGNDDTIQLLNQDSDLVGGHLATANNDYDVLTNLNPDVKEHIYLIERPMLEVSKEKVNEIKTDKKAEYETDIFTSQ